MGTLIDASVLIAVERGQLDPDEIFGSAGRRDEAVAIAAVTASELLHGVHQLEGARHVRAERFARYWLSALPVIPVGPEVAHVYATLAAELAITGTRMGAHDLLIAATAVHLGYRVATRDPRSFHRVNGLPVDYL